MDILEKINEQKSKFYSIEFNKVKKVNDEVITTSRQVQNAQASDFKDVGEHIEGLPHLKETSRGIQILLRDVAKMKENKKNGTNNNYIISTYEHLLTSLNASNEKVR
jgi:hypothetical protein